MKVLAVRKDLGMKSSCRRRHYILIAKANRPGCRAHRPTDEPIDFCHSGHGVYRHLNPIRQKRNNTYN